jgi:hypothetical protein
MGEGNSNLLLVMDFNVFLYFDENLRASLKGKERSEKFLAICRKVYELHRRNYES